MLFSGRRGDLFDLHFTHFRIGIELNKGHSVTNCIFKNCLTDWNAENGIWVRGGAKENIFEGGASINNGTDFSATGGTQVGHGIKFSNTSHSNIVDNYKLNRNIEDGCQSQTSAKGRANRNIVRNSILKCVLTPGK